MFLHNSLSLTRSLMQKDAIAFHSKKFGVLLLFFFTQPLA